MSKIIREKQNARAARKLRVRKKITGTGERPRLAVFKSLRHVYVQLIDDEKGATLLSASSLADEVKGAGKVQAAAIGKLIAERAQAKGVENVVFDRSSYRYHGVVRALAEAAREAGLKF